MKLKRISFMRVDNRIGLGDDLPKLADMLRYDVAFQCQADPHLIAFPVFQTKDGNLGGTITHGRWLSFGVLVKYLTDAQEALAKGYKQSQWITFHHPRNEFDQLDYSKLVPVTLEAYCQAKDPRDL